MGYSLVAVITVFFGVNMFYFAMEFFRILRIFLLRQFGVKWKLTVRSQTKRMNSEVSAASKKVNYTLENIIKES